MERNIFLVWFGPEMSDNRKNALKILQENCKVKTTLVTYENLKNFEIKNYPIHEGFFYLNAQNQSDYIRSYLIHHYGGAYSDIKPISFDWNPYFEELENSDMYIIGSPEIKGGISGSAGKDAVNAWEELVACPYLICKKNTPFTKYWYEITQKLIDEKFEKLKKNPGTYHPLASTGGYFDSEHNFHYDKRGENFPFQWNEIYSGRLHLAQYKYKDKIIIKMPMPMTYGNKNHTNFIKYR